MPSGAGLVFRRFSVGRGEFDGMGVFGQQGRAAPSSACESEWGTVVEHALAVLPDAVRSLDRGGRVMDGDARLPDAGLRWEGAILEATVFRDCELNRSHFEDVRSRKAKWLRCELRDATGLPVSAAALFALSWGLTRSLHVEEGGGLWIANGHFSAASACAWSPDGKQIVSASRDGSVRIWDSETGVELRRICLREVLDGLAWAAINLRNNRILAGDAEAWRMLGWRSKLPDGREIIRPAATHGPLPIQGAQA